LGTNAAASPISRMPARSIRSLPIAVTLTGSVWTSVGSLRAVTVTIGNWSGPCTAEACGGGVSACTTPNGASPPIMPVATIAPHDSRVATATFPLTNPNRRMESVLQIPLWTMTVAC